MPQRWHTPPPVCRYPPPNAVLPETVLLVRVRRATTLYRPPPPPPLPAVGRVARDGAVGEGEAPTGLNIPPPAP